MNCICSVIKDEHPYIREWSLHHLALGFDKIFLYDNNSSKPYDKEIGDLMGLGKIEIKIWRDSTKSRQLTAFHDLMQSKEWGDADWCAFIDVDEFIFLDEGRNISQFISLYERYAGVALYWKCYNANGRIKAPQNVSTIDAYTAQFIFNDYSTKIICRVKDVQNFILVHLAVPKWGKTIVTTSGTPHCLWNIKDLNYVNGHVKHFFTKSWEDWIKRMKRGNITPKLRQVHTFFECNPDLKYLERELTKELNYHEFPSL